MYNREDWIGRGVELAVFYLDATRWDLLLIAMTFRWWISAPPGEISELEHV